MESAERILHTFVLCICTKRASFFQIDILAGHVRSGVTGQMTFNGLPLRAADFQKRSCYVLQRDVLLATATVRCPRLAYKAERAERQGTHEADIEGLLSYCLPIIHK